MFKVGAKIVCVDDTMNIYWGPNYLVFGDVYTVVRLTPPNPPYQVWGIHLAEVVCNAPAGFRHNRFRPAVERKTGFELLERLLNPKNHDPHVSDQFDKVRA